MPKASRAFCTTMRSNFPPKRVTASRFSSIKVSLRATLIGFLACVVIENASVNY